MGNVQQEAYYRKDRKKVTPLDFCRNVLIANIPERFSTITRKLVPYNPDFIFFTHARNENDIYATFPFIEVLKWFLPERLIRKILDLSPCYIVSFVDGPNGTRGYFISVTALPDHLFSSRELTAKLIQSSMAFFKKISSQKVVVGLAAWWPIVSNAGLLFEKHLKKEDNLIVTNGHTATLASLYLSVLKLSETLQIPTSQVKLLIIGVGKIGGSLAELLVKDIGKVGLADKNRVRLEIARKNLQQISPSVEVETVAIRDDNSQEMIASKVQQYDITVCTTSNTGLLITDETKLKNCIILDDSRPEAFPRIFLESQKALVLEGGLMKIPNVRADSDFGFGKEENVFGCLSEAIMLAIDRSGKLKPSLGEIDHENLDNLIGFCKASNIEVGDFKCGDKIITADQIKAVFLPVSRARS